MRINLKNCPNLRELKMPALMLISSDAGSGTIGSIQPEEIKKITFTTLSDEPLYVADHLRKNPDRALCGLKKEGVVELEVQISRLSFGDDPKYEDCLPGFLSKGLVRFVDATGKVIYSGGAVDHAAACRVTSTSYKFTCLLIIRLILSTYSLI